MPHRFYFHLREPENFCCDDEGQDFDDLPAAIRSAELDGREIISQLMKEGRKVSHKEIEIVDETDKVVHTIKLRELVLSAL